MSSLVRQAEATIASVKNQIHAAIEEEHIRKDQEADAHHAAFQRQIAARPSLRLDSPVDLVHQLGGVRPFK